MIREKSYMYLYVFVIGVVREIYEGESDGDNTSVQGSNLPRDFGTIVNFRWDDETSPFSKHLFTAEGLHLI